MKRMPIRISVRIAAGALALAPIAGLAAAAAAPAAVVTVAGTTAAPPSPGGTPWG